MGVSMDVNMLIDTQMGMIDVDVGFIEGLREVQLLPMTHEDDVIFVIDDWGLRESEYVNGIDAYPFKNEEYLWCIEMIDILSYVEGTALIICDDMILGNKNDLFRFYSEFIRGYFK